MGCGTGWRLPDPLKTKPGPDLTLDQQHGGKFNIMLILVFITILVKLIYPVPHRSLAGSRLILPRGIQEIQFESWREPTIR